MKPLETLALCLLIFFAGCVSNSTQICKPPYIQVNNSCCLDNNTNQICDNTEIQKNESKSEILNPEKIPENTSVEVNNTPLLQQPEKYESITSSTHLSGGIEDNAYWMRSGWFHWGSIEPEKGQIDWKIADEFITDHQKESENILLVIFPFAKWDQQTCHDEDDYTIHFDPKKGGDVMVGPPCDMTAYLDFLSQLVERYDGDGINDMPGLEVPVKYYEILNEPSIRGEEDEDLQFFKGSPLEYLEILKQSYQTIKTADPEAQVLHAGCAGMHSQFNEFWDQVFSEGAEDYFDIANIHSINTDNSREDLFYLKFKQFLNNHGISDKPIWITEAQYGGLDDTPNDVEAFNNLIAKSTVFSLALGADKIFFIKNWDYWEDESKSTKEVYLNLLDLVNTFDSVEIIKQEYVQNTDDAEGSTSLIGHYKFINNDAAVYVLWGDANIPSEITGTVEVTDIQGNSKVMESNQLISEDSPIFVRMK